MPHKPRQRPGIATLRSVAERAGVSTMTVSNVINGTGKVGEATRQRVREAIGATGYVPNIAARRLAGAAGTRVGLVFPDGRTPFLAEVLLATLEAATLRGSQLVVREGVGRDIDDARALLDQALDAGAEALVLVPPYAERLAEAAVLARFELPAVAFAAAGPMPGMHSVRIDNRAAADALASHLIELGHRQIGFITGPMDHADSLERLEGFRAAMRRHRLPVRAGMVVAGAFTFASGCEATDRLLALPRRPTAIIASNDDMAVGAQWAAQRAGLQLPAQLSVAGFDDTAAARRAWPPLTVIRQPIAGMATIALDLLMAALCAPEPPSPRDVVVPHELVVRASTCAPA